MPEPPIVPRREWRTFGDAFSRLLAKLYARDRAQLVVLAYESGVIVPGGAA